MKQKQLIYSKSIMAFSYAKIKLNNLAIIRVGAPSVAIWSF
jgi:hypothetical protein